MNFNDSQSVKSIVSTDNDSTGDDCHVSMLYSVSDQQMSDIDDWGTDNNEEVSETAKKWLVE